MGVWGWRAGAKILERAVADARIGPDHANGVRRPPPVGRHVAVECEVRDDRRAVEAVVLAEPSADEEIVRDLGAVVRKPHLVRDLQRRQLGSLAGDADAAARRLAPAPHDGPAVGLVVRIQRGINRRSFGVPENEDAGREVDILAGLQQLRGVGSPVSNFGLFPAVLCPDVVDDIHVSRHPIWAPADCQRSHQETRMDGN